MFVIGFEKIALSSKLLRRAEKAARLRQGKALAKRDYKESIKRHSQALTFKWSAKDKEGLGK
jgi:hypothetical protein